MNAQEHLRALIDRQNERIRTGIPSDREAAVLAVIRAHDQIAQSAESDRRLADLGRSRALQLCFASTVEDITAVVVSPDFGLEDWGERFLLECGRLVEAETVLGHCESGFMRMVEDGSRTFEAWIATRRAPASWRERADVDWWAAWLAKRHLDELHALQAVRPDPKTGNPGHGSYYRKLANVHLKLMAYQFGYPPEAVIDGCSVQTYLDVLGRLIGWALEARDRGEATATRSERALVSAIAEALKSDPVVIGRAVVAFTLDQDSADFHGAVPGVAASPGVRVGPDRIVWSAYGLTTQPPFFMTRELKRRAAQEYHNTAYLREVVFRQDLYTLFHDKRFVASAGQIELRRDAGNVRTDIDAVVFDRQTGTLGLFELKSHDPFARSVAELARRRDNVLYANRQISGALDWLNRHGGDDLLGRVDSRTAKTFRVQRVYPFVLGRYLAHFNDGPAPDRRAAWGTWPQLLRLIDGQADRAGVANPIASMFDRLTKDDPLVFDPDELPTREIVVGDALLTVHPSYLAYQASGAEERGSRAQ